ncbi:unnamed protein product [Rhizoctonia solani]|uniref:Uncharacterized protein n=1 Tax=Rhizoctonia solani TaxID=456999 RepID=A0A8H3BRT3_9AGAM|nr:unnamed protein product [Rhizoctonia solani]CAE6482175.1 unnamed protein product [Rhizoctonia solani]
MKHFAISAALLLVASGVGARPQEESSISVFPLPTIVPDPPSISSGFPPLPTSTPLSLTPRPSTSTSSQPTTTALSSAVGTSNTLGSQTTGATTSASVTSPIASATSALSSVLSSASSAASAAPTNNAAPAQFEPLKVNGLAALGVVTTVFASMLFVL